ncbi:hypothetical protein [Sphingomonas sp.]|uniref:hypothetical protein n=1 Tax=Sphingomonas sp. TaxID=28214 RepID=UPI003B00C3FD
MLRKINCLLGRHEPRKSAATLDRGVYRCSCRYCGKPLVNAHGQWEAEPRRG